MLLSSIQLEYNAIDSQNGETSASSGSYYYNRLTSSPTS